MKQILKRAYARKHPSRSTDNAAAVYDGRRYLGLVEPHGKTAFRAIDCNDRVIGIFSTRHAAALAIMGRVS
jgi:hypothetical protein